MSWQGAAAMLLCAACLQSCAEYQVHVLNPVASEAGLTNRTFEGAPTLEALIAYGLRNSPDLQAARARAETASAALITARQRINPSLSGEGGYNRTPESVVTYSVSPAFTIETGGKRGYRILAAEKLAEAARVAVFETEWEIRSRIRNAALDCWRQQERLTRLRTQNDIRAEIVEIFSKRLEAGEAASQERNAARAEQASAALEVRNAEGALESDRAALAGAAGLPAAALAHAALAFPSFETPPRAAALPLLRVKQAGLLHRADIRRSLAEYEAADARVRLALANRYPNISLNPAYAFQEGFPAYTLGAVVENLPVFHRNAGPVAEAEAARRQAEADFIALQANVLTRTEVAERHYAAAADEWQRVTDTLLPLQRGREEAVQLALRAGEANRLDLAQARLATVQAELSRDDATLAAQQALGALEDAVQSPLLPESSN